MINQENYPQFIISNTEKKYLMMRVPEKGIDHLLRASDRLPVREVLDFLKANNAQSYVGGKVLRRQLLEEDYYPDIVLMGVANAGEQNSDLIKICTQLNRKAYGDILLGNQKFAVKAVPEIFLDAHIPFYFLTPRDSPKSSNINLSLIAEEIFRESYSRVQLMWINNF